MTHYYQIFRGSFWPWNGCQPLQRYISTWRHFGMHSWCFIQSRWVVSMNSKHWEKIRPRAFLCYALLCLLFFREYWFSSFSIYEEISITWHMKKLWDSPIQVFKKEDWKDCRKNSVLHYIKVLRIATNTISPKQFPKI